MSVLDDIRSAPMGRYQVRVVAVCLALMVLDGFDVSVMAFAAPALTAEWQVGPVMLGYLLSASLFGMAAGSVLLTPLADRLGRRPLTIGSIALVVVGMIGSTISPDAGWMLATRIVTGIGIGGMVGNLNVLVAEMSSDRRRGLAMSVYAVGFPIGAALCGFLAAPMVPAYGWRSLFLAGAVLTALMLLVALRALPESLEFLLNRSGPAALARVNDALGHLGREPLTELPTARPTSVAAAAREVFAGRSAARTVLLWIGFGMLVGGYYFATTWTPKIVATVTGDAGLGALLGAVAQIGGIVGTLIFGFATAAVGTRRLLAMMLAGSALAYLVFGMVLGNGAAAIAVVAVLGALVLAGVAGYYTVGAQAYSVRARATGMGWMVGVGRFVSIAAPVIVGYLLAAEVAPGSVFMLFAGPMLLSAVCVAALGARRLQDPSDDRPGAPVAVTRAAD
jgi:benzoate transport